MSWQRVRGHDALAQAFDRAWQRGRLAHAYFFTGPPGVGKHLFAVELAKALLCETKPKTKLDACDTCPACRQVEAGTHPDFFAASRPADSPNIPIEVVRELCHNLALKPARGRDKVAILDDADDLHDPITLHAAANAFLKTLEEPPPGSVLILVGTSTDQQLPTILSRCQIVRFAPLPPALVAKLLRTQGMEDVKLVERLARLSSGSPGQARELADPALWDFRRQFLDGLVRTPVDSVALAQMWVRFVEEAGKESALQRRRAALVVRFLIEFLDDALCLTQGGLPRLTEPDDLRALQQLANRVDADRLLQALDRCLEADFQIDRRVHLVLVLEALLDALGQLVK